MKHMSIVILSYMSIIVVLLIFVLLLLLRCCVNESISKCFSKRFVAIKCKYKIGLLIIHLLTISC